ncbi:MAG: GNAT family N-acetyltransferase [Anaerolineae bacterium]|nr:GNAT family N-acetyltransferase [Anaerolineae bacterium]
MTTTYPPSAALTVTPYNKRSRHLVRELLSRNFYTHVHLDWHESDQWMDSEQAIIRLAWLNNNLVGLLALSEPLHDTCWVRLAAVLDHTDTHQVIYALWQNAEMELRERGVRRAAMLMIRDWAAPLLQPLGFRFEEEIVTLRHTERMAPEVPMLPENISLRAARSDDVPAMAAVDHHAFMPPWQMAISDIRQAERVAANSTVAVQNINGQNRIVGYQMSTLYFDGAHLARLAVDPAVQNHGVASALLAELLRYFNRRGVYVVTVNTQASNHVSRHLYSKFAFYPNGYDLPVWVKDLS